MSTVHKILKNALKNMNYVGSGCYAAAFDSNKEIVKIGADIFDPYLYYLREIKSLKTQVFSRWFPDTSESLGLNQCQCFPTNFGWPQLSGYFRIV